MTSEKKLEANRRNALRSTGPRTPEGKARTSRNAMKHGLFVGAPVVPGLERREVWDIHRAGVVRSLSPVGYLEELLAERAALLLWRLGRVARYEREAISLGLEKVEEDVAENRTRSALAPGSLEAAREKREMSQALLRGLEALTARQDEERVDRDDAVRVFWALHETASHEREDELEVSVPGVPEDDDAFDAFDGWTVGLLRRSVLAYGKEVGLGPEVLVARMTGTARADLYLAEKAEKELQTAMARARRQRILPDEEVLEKVTRYELTAERSLYRTLQELERIQASRAGAPALPPVVDVEVLGNGEDATLEAEVVPPMAP